MTDEPTKMLSLGRLNKRTKKDQDGNDQVYFTGNLMISKLRDVKTFTDKFNNEKIGIVVFVNDYKQEETDPDFKIFESRPPKPKAAGDDMPF